MKIHVPCVPTDGRLEIWVFRDTACPPPRRPLPCAVITLSDLLIFECSRKQSPLPILLLYGAIHKYYYYYAGFEILTAVVMKSTEETFLCFTAPKPALRPTQAPSQWVPGSQSPGIMLPGRESDHSPPSSAEVKKGVAIPPLSHISSWLCA
jgi:hypothetical protein